MENSFTEVYCIGIIMKKINNKKRKYLILLIILFCGIFIGFILGNKKVEINNIIAYNQHPKYPNGCETVALYILLNHYDNSITIDKIIDKLPKGPYPYLKDGILYGANPEKEYVGSPDGKCYGVYNKPIAETANKFKKGFKAKNNVSLKEIKRILDTGNPLIAWIKLLPDKTETIYTWTDYETGKLIEYPSIMHAIVIYGYDNNNIYISDPYDGEKYMLDTKKFENYFSKLGRRIVYYDD